MITVVINRERRIRADIGSLRPDVPAYLGEPRAAVDCGWMALVDLSAEPQGELRVQVEAADPGRVPELILDRAFFLRGDGLTGCIEVPADGAVVRGNLLAITGWVHAIDGVARVDAYMDGEHLGAARLGLPRASPQTQDQQQGVEADGWELRCVVDAAAPLATRDINVMVTDRHGHRARLGSVKVGLQGQDHTESDPRLIESLQEGTRRQLSRISQRKSEARRNVLVATASLSIGGSRSSVRDLLQRLIPSLESCDVIAAEDGPLAHDLKGFGAEVSISSRPAPADAAGYEGAIRELAGFIRGLQAIRRCCSTASASGSSPTPPNGPESRRSGPYTRASPSTIGLTARTTDAPLRST